MDQEEIKESMKDANNKFNEAYKELQQHNMALKSESLDAKADLLDKIEELKRIKGLALKRAQGSSNGDSQPDSMASMIERQRWERVPMLTRALQAHCSCPRPQESTPGVPRA